MVKTALALLTPEIQASRHMGARSVEGAWSRMDRISYAGPTRAAPTLAIVSALRMVHDEAPDRVDLANPRQEVVERNGRKNDAATIATVGIPLAGVVAQGVAVTKLGQATTMVGLRPPKSPRGW